MLTSAVLPERHDALYVVGALDEAMELRGMRYHPIDIETSVIRTHKSIMEWYNLLTSYISTTIILFFRDALTFKFGHLFIYLEIKMYTVYTIMNKLRIKHFKLNSVKCILIFKVM